MLKIILFLGRAFEYAFWCLPVQQFVVQVTDCSGRKETEPLFFVLLIFRVWRRKNGCPKWEEDYPAPTYAGRKQKDKGRVAPFTSIARDASNRRAQNPETGKQSSKETLTLLSRLTILNGVVYRPPGYLLWFQSTFCEQVEWPLIFRPSFASPIHNLTKKNSEPI